jgi:hypothetical protein
MRITLASSSAALLALLAGFAGAQHQPGGSNAPGYPCGNRNLLRQENVGCASGLANDEHPNVSGTGTVAGTPFGDASWQVFDSNIWGWGSQSLDLQGYEIPAGVMNISNPAGVTVTFPTIYLFPAVSGTVQPPGGGMATALIPDVTAAAIDITAIGPVALPGGPNQCLGAAPVVGGNASSCLLGLFFINTATFQQPCAAALAPLPIATPQVVAPNGVAMVLAWPVGTINTLQDRWSQFRLTCESYGLSGSATANAGYYDGITMTFQAFPPTDSFFGHLAFDEPTMNARKLDGLSGTIDMGAGAYYLSIANNDALSVRTWSIEAGSDQDPGLPVPALGPGHVGLVLWSATPPGMVPPPFTGPNGTMNLGPFGFPTENLWFNLDALTFSFFPFPGFFLNTGTVVNAASGTSEEWLAPPAPGAFSDVIWNTVSSVPVGGAGAAGVGATLYLQSVTLDLPNTGPSSSPTPGPRIMGSNSIAVHLVP